MNWLSQFERNFGQNSQCVMGKQYALKQNSSDNEGHLWYFCKWHDQTKEKKNEFYCTSFYAWNMLHYLEDNLNFKRVSYACEKAYIYCIEDSPLCFWPFQNRVQRPVIYSTQEHVVNASILKLCINQNENRTLTNYILCNNYQNITLQIFLFSFFDLSFVSVRGMKCTKCNRNRTFGLL